MNISVGLPVYDSKLHYEVASCLLTETRIAQEMGDRLMVRFLPSCTNLAMGRNQIVKDFMDSGDDRLVFLDADVTYEPGKLVRIAHYPEEFVGGAYRYKTKEEDYPVAWLEDEEHRLLQANEHGLLRVKMVPTGFLSLSRSVFEKFSEKHSGRDYESRDSRTFCYFQIPYSKGVLYTEDAYFCEEWRDMGGKIYLDPEINLSHWDGNLPYPGHIGNWLKRRAGLAPAA